MSPACLIPDLGWMTVALVVGLQVGFAAIGTLIGIGVFILMKEM